MNVENNIVLPDVIVASLNLYYAANLALRSTMTDVPADIATLAGDLLNPLHLRLTEIACENTPMHCAKMRFAAAAVDAETGEVLATGFNRRVRSDDYGLSEPLYCRGADCIRLRVPARTDALIGECEHALWITMRALEHQGVDLKMFTGPNPRVQLYEAGFSSAKDGPNQWLPWVGTEPFYTCLYCVDKLVRAGIEAVWAIKKLPNQDAPRWTRIDVRESLVHDALIAQSGY